MAKRVAEIVPKAEEVVLPDGWAKFGWLRMSNASTRSLKVRLSSIFVSFSPERSISLKPGPKIMLRDMVPSVVLVFWKLQLGGSKEAEQTVDWMKLTLAIPACCVFWVTIG